MLPTGDPWHAVSIMKAMATPNTANVFFIFFTPKLEEIVLDHVDKMSGVF
jgi:hypothetical protein